MDPAVELINQMLKVAMCGCPGDDPLDEPSRVMRQAAEAAGFTEDDEDTVEMIVASGDHPLLGLSREPRHSKVAGQFFDLVDDFQQEWPSSKGITKVEMLVKSGSTKPHLLARGLMSDPPDGFPTEFKGHDVYYTTDGYRHPLFDRFMKTAAQIMGFNIFPDDHGIPEDDKEEEEFGTELVEEAQKSDAAE